MQEADRMGGWCCVGMMGGGGEWVLYSLVDLVDGWGQGSEVRGQLLSAQSHISSGIS